MNPLRSIIYIIGIVAVLTSCQGGNNRVATLEKGDTVRFDYATLLTVVRYSDHTHVEIANPWVKGSVLRSYDISRPLGKAVVTTTAHCQLLTWLGKSSAIAGVCDSRYIGVDEVRKRLVAGKTVDCGNSMNPDVFGINGGAGLGVALVMLLAGGSVTLGTLGVTGNVAILAAAFAGAMAVMAIILFSSTLVRDGVMLLVIGIMVGYLSSSVVTLLNYSATEQGIRSFMLWGMGSLDGVTPSLLPLYVTITLAALVLSLLMVKPLNLLSLGDNYARNLGLNTRRARNYALLLTGLLTAVVTAYCGPIAFIGLAVPHIARLLTVTDDMRRLLPITMLTGAVVTMACHLLCFVPGEAGMLPLNAVTPLIGAPVIIYVIIRKR